MITFANTSNILMGPFSSAEGRPSLKTFLLRAVIALLVLSCVTAVEFVLFFRFNVHSPSSIYLVGIIIITAWCGTGYGLLSALASIMLCDFLFIGQPFSFQASVNDNLANAFIFVSASLLVGIYSDFIRERLGAARMLIEASQGFAHSDMTSNADIFRDLTSEEGRHGRFDLRAEAENIAVAVLMVACGSVISWGLNYAFQFQRSLSLFVTAVLITAITRGARAALVAAILAVVAFKVFSSGIEFGVTIDTVGDLLNLLLLSAIAWWVGSYADHVRHGRRMAQNLFEAGQIFSSMNNETAIRRFLHTTMVRVCNTSSVWIFDETGKSFDNRPAVFPTEALPNALSNGLGAKGMVAPPWHAHALQVEGRSYGFVVWFWPSMSQMDAAVVERVVTVLVDLAAGAIARARMSAEQIELQLVAQAEKLRTALLSSISHDFRTPLSGILGAATGLLELGEQYDKIRQRDLLLTIRNQAVRLNRYIENLLSLTQFENGVLNVKPKRLLLEPLIYDAWEALGDYGGSLRIIDVRIQQDAAVYADSFLLSQVLTNLFENAIKYTPKGSAIIVRGWTSGSSQLIEIVDSGPGVEEGSISRIFDRFYRGERQTSMGLGLGLYIAKGLLEAMHATVEARNRVDEKSGLIISITMPTGEGRR